MHYPVTVLGFGTRIGIWTQGCSIGCRGCISRDTWDPHAGIEVDVEDVLTACEQWASSGEIDGITISGGEPFDQADSVRDLLVRLENWLGVDRENVDILCYSGYPEHRLRRDHPAILERLDALIPNPYVSARAPGGRWRGSNNQSLRPLTRLGHARYGSVSSRPLATPEIQFVVDDGIWFIGVPQPGDMEALEERLRRRGIRLGMTSWR